ncbi:MAG: hypothetical protein IPN27_11570 [Cellvibrionales bacterium]|nr:hypothetical protein [Cellvibrionales bacterium]
MATPQSGTFDAKHLSTAAKHVCKDKHFTPKWFEPLNNGHTSKNPEIDETPRLRVWNTRREIIISESDLFYAANVE